MSLSKPATPVQVFNLCALHSIELTDMGVSWVIRLPSAQDELPKYLPIETIIERVKRLIEQSDVLVRDPLRGSWFRPSERYRK